MSQVHVFDDISDRYAGGRILHSGTSQALLCTCSKESGV